jgi:hypothetical protein
MQNRCRRTGALMKRRDFLHSAGALSAVIALPNPRRWLEEEKAPEAPWRTFDVTTRECKF